MGVIPVKLPRTKLDICGFIYYVGYLSIYLLKIVHFCSPWFITTIHDQILIAYTGFNVKIHQKLFPFSSKDTKMT